MSLGDARPLAQAQGFTVTAPTAELGLNKPLWAEHVVKVVRNLVEVLH